MRQLWLFFVKHHLVFLFLILILLGFSFLFTRSDYQRNKWLHQTAFLRAQVDDKRHEMTDYVDLRWQNELLIKENTHLRSLLDDMQNRLASTDSIVFPKDSLLNTQYQFINADVITNPLIGSYSHMTIDEGLKNGVYIDDGVITSDGVVGKIVQISPNYAIVMPLFNLNMRLNVQHSKSGYNGNLIWDGRNFTNLQVENIPRHANVQVGDSIRVNKFSKSLPVGSPVGVVEQVNYDQTGNFYNINVKPFVDFRRLNHVYVAHRKDIDEIIELEQVQE